MILYIIFFIVLTSVTTAYLWAQLLYKEKYPIDYVFTTYKVKTWQIDKIKEFKPVYGIRSVCRYGIYGHKYDRKTSDHGCSFYLDDANNLKMSFYKCKHCGKAYKAELSAYAYGGWIIAREVYIK